MEFLKSLIKKLIPNFLVVRKNTIIRSVNPLYTFDDGPDKKFTYNVLNLLDKHNIKAVFFVVGKFAEDHPEILSDIKRKGHVIGCHTYSHPRNFYKSFRHYYTDVKKCCDLIEKITGDKVVFFRPPQGKLDLNVFVISFLLRLKIILWSIEAGELGGRKGWKTEEIANYLTDNIQDDDIVLLHDNNQKSIDIFNMVISEIYG